MTLTSVPAGTMAALEISPERVLAHILRNADSQGRIVADPHLMYAAMLTDAIVAGESTEWAEGGWGEAAYAIARLVSQRRIYLRRRGPLSMPFDGLVPTIFVRHWDRVRPRRAFIPGSVRLAVYERDGHACVRCRSTEALSLDHIIPWSRGGSDDESNLQTLCRSCNSSKSDGGA